jgi:hypothetical protein
MQKLTWMRNHYLHFYARTLNKHDAICKLLREAGTAGFMRAALEAAPNMHVQPEAENSPGAARCGRSEALTGAPQPRKEAPAARGKL